MRALLTFTLLFFSLSYTTGQSAPVEVISLYNVAGLGEQESAIKVRFPESFPLAQIKFDLLRFNGKGETVSVIVSKDDIAISGSNTVEKYLELPDVKPKNISEKVIVSIIRDRGKNIREIYFHLEGFGKNFSLVDKKVKKKDLSNLYKIAKLTFFAEEGFKQDWFAEVKKGTRSGNPKLSIENLFLGLEKKTSILGFAKREKVVISNPTTFVLHNSGDATHFIVDRPLTNDLCSGLGILYGGKVQSVDAIGEPFEIIDVTGAGELRVGLFYDVEEEPSNDDSKDNAKINTCQAQFDLYFRVPDKPEEVKEEVYGKFCDQGNDNLERDTSEVSPFTASFELLEDCPCGKSGGAAQLTFQSPQYLVKSYRNCIEYKKNRDGNTDEIKYREHLTELDETLQGFRDIDSISFFATNLSETDTLVATPLNEKVWFSNEENSLSLFAGEYKVRIINREDTLKTLLFAVKPGANCGPQEAIVLLGGVEEITRLKYGETDRTAEEYSSSYTFDETNNGQYALISLDPVKLGEFSLDNWFNFGIDGGIRAFWRKTTGCHLLQAPTVIDENAKRKYAKVYYDRDDEKTLGDGIVLFKKGSKVKLSIYGEENFTKATVYVRYFKIN